MNYEIIFYHSGKTAETERLIEKNFGNLRLKKRTTEAAVRPEELGTMLGRALKKADIVVIIGGLDGGVQSTDMILSSILSAKGSGLKCERLIDDDDNIAYMIGAGKQNILVFPDETEVIGTMLEKRINQRLKTQYSLTEVSEDIPSFESVKKDLEDQLQGQDKMRSGYAEEYVRKEKTELKKLRIIIAGVSVLGAVLAAAGIIILAL